jgi:hypothetical protein
VEVYEWEGGKHMLFERDERCMGVNVMGRMKGTVHVLRPPSEQAC